LEAYWVADVKDPTLPRQSAHRWRQGCRLYAPAALYSPETLYFRFWYSFWPPLWSSGQSSWLQMQRSGFDSRRHQFFCELVGLERGPLSLVSTTEEIHERKRSGSSLENQEYSHKDPSRWRRGTLYPQKLVLTSPKSCGRSVGTVR
jgi:hypothetical protein